MYGCGIHSICSDIGISVPEIPMRIEKFCSKRTLRLTFLDLEDDSYINYEDNKFSLFIINILKKGLSYYNERGYLQKIFTEDVAHWNELKNKNFIRTVAEIDNKKTL